MLINYPTLHIPNPVLSNLYKYNRFSNNLMPIRNYIEDLYQKQQGQPMGEINLHLYKKYINSFEPFKINPYALTSYPVRKYCTSDQLVLYRHLNKIIRPLTFLKDFRYEKNTLEVIDSYLNQSILCVAFYNLWSKTPLNMTSMEETINLFTNESCKVFKKIGKLVIIKEICMNKPKFYIQGEKPRSESLNKLFNQYLHYCNNGRNTLLTNILTLSKQEKNDMNLVPKNDKDYIHNNNKVIYCFKKPTVVITRLFDFWKPILFCYCLCCQKHSMSKISTKTPSMFAYDIINKKHVCTLCFKNATTVRVQGDMIYIGWENKNYWQCLGCGDLCCEGKCEKKCYELKNNTCYMRTQNDPKTCNGFEIQKGVFVCYNHYKFYKNGKNKTNVKITCKKLHHRVVRHKPSTIFKSRKRCHASI